MVKVACNKIYLTVVHAIDGQLFLKSVLLGITRSPHSLFDRGCSYLTHQLLSVSTLWQMFQITNTTLELIVNVPYT